MWVFYRAMLELDQILRANEINFAVLAALPAFILSFILLMLVRAWFKQVSNTEGCLLYFMHAYNIWFTGEYYHKGVVS